MIYNFSNISSGGGVQVSLSLIEFFLKDSRLKQHKFLFSKNLYLIVKKSQINLSGVKYKVVNNILERFLYLSFNSEKIIFTVFGPTYAIKFQNKIWINGFAQPWILFPKNDLYDDLSVKLRVLYKIKFMIQSMLFRMSNLIIVEHNFIKNKLSNRFKNIIVAENSINQAFLDKSNWKKLILRETSKPKIGIIGSGYIHKNLKIIPFVKKSLLKNQKIDAEFYVTLKPEEYNSLGNTFKKNVNNIGQIDISQCPSFYMQMDLIFFPTKLECFSATILESVFMNKKIVCADYEFNKYISSSLIFYYTQNDYESAVKQISNALAYDKFIPSDSKNLIKKYNPEKRFDIIKSAIFKYTKL